MPPHPYYRLNPSRAVYINGTINAELLSRVTPEILKLQTISREPITVYIDSRGGSVRLMETILRTLKLSDQDSSEPCHIITCVTTRAASAAADLLSSGDYAIAYPHSAILYHGIRTQESDPLTVESTSILVNMLRRTNDIYAVELARKIDDRFTYKFLIARNGFANIRQKHNNQQLSDLDCFIEFIDERLSTEAQKVWKSAKERHARYSDLFDTVLQKTKSNIAKMTLAQAEAVAIKAIVEFEVKANKINPKWSFRGGGMERLYEDFFLFNEYLSDLGDQRLQRWATTWGKYILSSDEAKEIDSIADEKERTKKLSEKLAPVLEPLTSFFAALCHALQEGENELTATDAYWLGLIDEVVGEDHLLCLRYFEENPPEPEPANEEEQQEKAKGDAQPEPAGA